MPDNTDPLDQKSEKLLAKLILASTNPGDVGIDPFLGIGTASVVAKKLGRRYVGIAIAEELALIAEQRLHLVERDAAIQAARIGCSGFEIRWRPWPDRGGLRGRRREPANRMSGARARTPRAQRGFRAAAAA